ncbi:sugar transporter ERD6-like 6 isoform X5 [Euphorbia lathyris]|uniref:sugar transporter ERD6-like 6 isoform X5 n=1 Tax=Euphorbia lathyris TaxID=212925 RepID=UPI003313E7C1
MLIASYSIRFHSGYSSPTQTAITEDLGLTVPESFCRILLFSTWEGFGVGIISYTIPVYIAEIAPQNLRGDLGSVNQIYFRKFNDAEETLTKALNKAEQLFGLNTIQQRRG